MTQRNVIITTCVLLIAVADWLKISSVNFAGFLFYSNRTIIDCVCFSLFCGDNSFSSIDDPDHQIGFRWAEMRTHASDPYRNEYRKKSCVRFDANEQLMDTTRVCSPSGCRHSARRFMCDQCVKWDQKSNHISRIMCWIVSLWRVLVDVMVVLHAYNVLQCL